MTVFAGVLDLGAWASRNTLALVACAGYIAFFAAIGIKWSRWEPR